MSTASIASSDDLGSFFSFDDVDTTVETPSRTMRVTVPAQKVLSSILGS